MMGLGARAITPRSALVTREAVKVAQIDYAARWTPEEIFTEPMPPATPLLRGAQHPIGSQPLGERT
jgi:hypothetical protein